MAASNRYMSQAISSTVNLYCNGCHSQIGIFENDWTRLTTSYARPQANATHFGTEVGRKTQIVPDGSAQSAAAGCELAEVFCKNCSAMVGQYCKGSRDTEKRYLIDQYFYKTTRTYLKDARTFAKAEHIFGMSDNTSRQGSRIPLRPIRAGSRALQGPTRNGSVPPQHKNKQFGPSTSTSTGRRQSSLPHASRYAQEESSSNLDLAMEVDPEVDETIEMLQRQEEKLAAQEKLLDKQSVILCKHSTQLTDLKKTIENNAVQIREQATTSSAVLAHLQALQRSIGNLQVSIKELKSEGNTNQTSTPRIANKTADASEIQDLSSANRPLRDGIAESQTSNGPNETATTFETRHDDAESVSNSSPATTSILGKRRRPDFPDDASLPHRESKVSCYMDGNPQLPTPHSVVPPHVSASTSPQPDISFYQSGAAESSDYVDEAMIVGDNAALDFVGNSQSYFDEHAGRGTKIPQNPHEAIEKCAVRDQTEGAASSTTAAAKPVAQTGSLKLQALRAREHGERISVVLPDALAAAFLQDPTHNAHEGLEECSRGHQQQRQIANGAAAQEDYTEATGKIDNEAFDCSKIQDANIDPRLRSTIAHDPDATLEASDAAATAMSRQTSVSPMRGASTISEMDDTSMTTSTPPSARRDNRRHTGGFDQGVRSMAPEPTQRRRTTMHEGVKMIDLDDARHSTPDLVARKIQSRGLPKEKKRRVQTSERTLNKELAKLGLSEWIGKDKNNREYRKAVSAARAHAREQAKQEALMKLNPNINTEPISDESLTTFKPTEPAPPPVAAAVVPGPFVPVASTLMYPQGVPLCSPMSFQPFGASPSRFTKGAIVFNPFTPNPEEVDKDKEQVPAPISPSEQKRQRLAKIRERDRLVKELMEKDD